MKGVVPLQLLIAGASEIIWGDAFVLKTRRLRYTQPRSATSISMEIASSLPRVVVTGAGITSCLGNTVEDVTSALRDGRSGIRFMPEYADHGVKSHLCGKPDLSEADLKGMIPKRDNRFLGNAGKYVYAAMVSAIADAGLEPGQYEENPRAGLFAGVGGMTSLEDAIETVAAVSSQAPRWRNKVGPFRVTKVMSSNLSAVLTTAFKLQGPSWSISSACATGAHCIGTGMQQIQLGNMDIAFCGGGEAECVSYAAGYDCMGALTTKYNETPERASRPFDKTRDGFVVAAGGGVVVLEELEHAKARGAKIYAELVGYAATSDGYEMVAPSGIGGQRCIELAKDMADRIGGKKKVEYVNAHGTSTPVGDTVELVGIKAAFSEDGYQPWVGSTKALSGHALGAAGVHEAIYCVLMMNNDFMAESANINELVDEAEGMNILRSRRDGPFSRTMSNSFGFGGHNCVLIFDKYVE